jgi:Skp family chaperone for outer membrane proteins
LKAEAKEAQARLVAKQKKGAELQEQIKELNEGSPEYTSGEARLVKLAAEFETEKKMMGNEFQKKEARLYHMVYLEIQDAVEKFCAQYKFTVVMRFNRTDVSSTDPQRVQQLMNQSVVYHRNRDDLSEGVLKYLNEKYRKSAGVEARPVTDKPAKKDSKVKTAGATKSAD